MLWYHHGTQLFWIFNAFILIYNVSFCFLWLIYKTCNISIHCLVHFFSFFLSPSTRVGSNGLALDPVNVITYVTLVWVDGEWFLVILLLVHFYSRISQKVVSKLVGNDSASIVMWDTFYCLKVLDWDVVY